MEKKTQCASVKKNPQNETGLHIMDISESELKFQLKNHYNKDLEIIIFEENFNKSISK